MVKRDVRRLVLRSVTVATLVVLTTISCSPQPDSGSEATSADVPTVETAPTVESTTAPTPTPEPTDTPAPTEAPTPIPPQAPTRDEALQILVSAADVASPSFTLENRGQPTIRGADSPDSVWVNREVYAYFSSGALHKVLVDLAFAGTACPSVVASFVAGGQAVGEISLPVPAGSSLSSDTGIIASSITGHVVLETCHGQFLIGVSTSDVEMGGVLAGQDAYVELARLVAEAQIAKLVNAGY
jgi:hypothetical protein